VRKRRAGEAERLRRERTGSLSRATQASLDESIELQVDVAAEEYATAERLQVQAQDLVNAVAGFRLGAGV